jgi:tetratricopeptide (TPR) repeat protein
MAKRSLLAAIALTLVVFAALSVAAKEILVSKDPAALYFELGKRSFEDKDYGSAISNFLKSTELNPEFAEAYYNLGAAYYYFGGQEDAIHNLEKAIELKEDYSKAHYSLALVQFEQGDYDKSITNLIIVRGLESNNANAGFDLAVSYVERFRLKETRGQSIIEDDLLDLKKSVSLYHEVLELEPGFEHALSNAQSIEEVISYYEEKI